MSGKQEPKPRVPPRWFVRIAWSVHRGLYRVTRGRIGLWPAKHGKWGTLRMTTIGRRTGRRRAVILAYFEDGPNLILLAMNGWGEGHPAWWRNLQGNPEAEVVLATGRRPVRARAAEGAELSRLWAGWRELEPKLDAYAALRSTDTPVVILEPQA